MSKSRPVVKAWWAKEGNRLLLALGLTAVSLALVGIARNKLGVQGDAPLVAVALLPLAYFALASGKLKGLKGPGDFEVLLGEATVVALGEAGVNPLDAAQQLFKGRMADLEAEMARVKDVAPVTLVIRPGNAEYKLDHLKEYVRGLQRFRHFGLVIFIDGESKLLAYIAPADFYALLMDDQEGEAFVQLLRHDVVLPVHLRTWDRMRIEPLRRGVTAKDALKAMREQELEAVPVVNDVGQLVGYTVRDQVVTDALLSLAS